MNFLRSRELNRKKAAEFLRLERTSEARTFIQRCVDVTHEMALKLIKRCRGQGVDCIVAPYEADAQLAFLNINGFAHIIITEDSDLMLFGCKMVSSYFLSFSISQFIDCQIEYQLFTF